jgi:putative SOS response-associated peptidase YedK
MCGRMVLTRSVAEIAESFGAVAALIELAPRYNVAPSLDIPVVRAGVDGASEGERAIALLRWGLVPSWAKDASIGNRMINARSETAAEKPSFRAALRRRRCLVPADGFYEWAKPAEKGERKTPHYFRTRNGAMMAMAGLWETWTDGETGEVIESCTLLTTESNSAVRPVHDRMPVLLERRDYALWLDPDVREAERVVSLLVPSPPDQLEDIVVSEQVNSPRNDDPSCIAPA